MSVVTRKILRWAASIFPVLYMFMSRKFMIIFLVVIVGCFLFLEIVRFRLPGINDWLFRHIKILKHKEKAEMSSITFFLISALLTIIFFRKDIAIAAMFFTTFGDSVSTLVGMKYGRTRIGHRSLEGSLAFLTVCVIISLLLTFIIDLRLRVLILGSIVGTVIELIPMPIDDNFTVPILCGFAMTLIV